MKDDHPDVPLQHAAAHPFQQHRALSLTKEPRRDQGHTPPLILAFSATS